MNENSFINRYLNYLKTNLLAKITLVMLVLLTFLGIFSSILLRDLIPTIFIILLLILYFLILALVFIAHYKKVIIAAVVEVLLSIFMIFTCVTSFKIDNASEELTNTESYEYAYIVALKESNITESLNFSNLTLGYASDDDLAYSRGTEILKDHSKKVLKSKPYQDTKKAYKAFKDGKIDLFTITSTTLSDLDLMCTDDTIDFINENYEEDYKVIFQKKYKLDSSVAKNVDISTQPFTLYLQGTDLSSGKNINSTGRGDVNILLTINPKTQKVNMQVIPRDLFVKIDCRGGRSKLSYSGWWGGIGSSIKSIEDYFGITINYYAKINFTGLMSLVDALDGVDAYSHFSYSANLDGTEYSWKKGMNHIKTGHEALVFARARKMLPENERSRGLQQMELIKAIFKKFSDEPTYNHAMSILDALTGNFTTNFPKVKFSKAFELVIELLPELTNMENHTIKGEYKWHYDEVRTNYYQYYFYPEKGEKEAVVERINAVLNGQ